MAHLRIGTGSHNFFDLRSASEVLGWVGVITLALNVNSLNEVFVKAGGEITHLGFQSGRGLEDE